MTKTNKRWTKEEEEILVQAVKANPQNKKYAGTSFLVIGRNTFADNRKITTTGYKTVSSKRKTTLWHKIKNLIFHK